MICYYSLRIARFIKMLQFSEGRNNDDDANVHIFGYNLTLYTLLPEYNDNDDDEEDAQ